MVGRSSLMEGFPAIVIVRPTQDSEVLRRYPVRSLPPRAARSTDGTVLGQHLGSGPGSPRLLRGQVDEGADRAGKAQSEQGLP